MTEPEITVYGAHWCPDCRRSKQFLGEHQIPYNWVDIEQDKEAEQFVIEKNEGKRIIPGIFAAGDVRDKSTKQVVSAAGEGGQRGIDDPGVFKGDMNNLEASRDPAAWSR